MCDPVPSRRTVAPSVTYWSRPASGDSFGSGGRRDASAKAAVMTSNAAAPTSLGFHIAIISIPLN